MGTWIAQVKDFFSRVLRQLAEAASSITEQQVLIDESGHVIVSEPALNLMSKKVAAVVLMTMGLVLVSLPTEARAVMPLGDQMIRTATEMWNGG